MILLTSSIIHNNDVIISYSKYIWVLNDKSYFNYAETLNNIFEFKLYSLQAVLLELRNYYDVIIISYEHEYVLNKQRALSHSVLSSNLFKLLKFFNIQRVTSYGEIDNFKSYIYLKDCKPLNKNTIFYHGTNDVNVKNILKTGCLNINQRSNFDLIQYENKIFITVDKNLAYGFAINSTRKNNTKPVIIKLLVPDINKLQPDTSTMVITGDTKRYNIEDLGYTDVIKKLYNVPDEKFRQRINRSGEDIQTKLGVFAYKGIIPKSFFKELI